MLITASNMNPNWYYYCYYNTGAARCGGSDEDNYNHNSNSYVTGSSGVGYRMANSATVSPSHIQFWQPWRNREDEAQILKCKGMVMTPTNGKCAKMTYGGSKRHQIIHHQEPIDMTTKKPKGSPPTYEKSLQMIQAGAVITSRRPDRPSVITSCTGGNNNDIHTTCGSPNNSRTTGCTTTADELLDDDGVDDPGVNAHFRRSLGKDYVNLFSNSKGRSNLSGNNLDNFTDESGTGLSVDDHFAKALGDDTWLRIQREAEKKKRQEVCDTVASSQITSSSMEQATEEQDNVVVSTSTDDDRDYRKILNSQKRIMFYKNLI